MLDYKLLPFTFKNLDDENVLIVNQAGEFTKLSKDRFCEFYSKELMVGSPIYKELKSKCFLTTDKDESIALELLSTKLRTRKAFVSEFTALHMIVATLRCNCQCRYCHASSVDESKNGYDMDWGTAKNTIDMIFQSPCDCLKIEYQGGEPLLNWEIVKESILYAKFLNKIAKKNVSFIICTNLMEITKEQLLFCKKHGVELSTSLDGLKHHHDKHRKSRNASSSYDSFIDKLSLTREILGKDACSPLLTITKDNLHSLKEIVHHYIELGFDNIFLRALNPYGNAVVNADDLSYPIEDFIDVYKEILMYVIQLNIDGYRFVESYASLFLSRILTPFSTGFVDLQSPSGAGISGVIYYYNGDIYPADEARMLARMGDDRFCMGNVNDRNYKKAFNGDVIRDIVYNSCVETMPVCSECPYQQYCGADPIRNYLETKDLMGDRLKSDFCKKNKLIMDFLFTLILENDEKVMDVFWSWITKRSYKELCFEAN